ncbi:hypothetical protein RvY_19114 [Ramazzottius varieornatus]|uniref:Receptor ligand binding region domain-containing protein n=1 Tax=Ramazzottius varieornatus TaxID=947166 RepID=A0A1D1WC28_RAMVA|nr:hypothetical protein RvY_19114 [Ramazzottius varieornatus]
MFGTVLKELLSDSNRPTDINDGSWLAGHFLNRTFTLDTGPIVLDETGERQQPLTVQHFQGSNAWPVTVMTLDAFAARFTDSTKLLWPVPFPPPNEPPCGFYESPNQISLIVGCLALLLLLLLFVAILIGIGLRTSRRAAGEASAWDGYQLEQQLLRLALGFSSAATISPSTPAIRMNHRLSTVEQRNPAEIALPYF